jgi:hypothetical protein
VAGVDGIPAEADQFLSAGLDGLLRDLSMLWANSGVGWVAEASDPDVLLETVAQTEDAHWQPAQTGNTEATRLLDGPEPEGLLAVVTDVGDADGDDQ